MLIKLVLIHLFLNNNDFQSLLKEEDGNNNRKGFFHTRKKASNNNNEETIDFFILKQKWLEDLTLSLNENDNSILENFPLFLTKLLFSNKYSLAEQNEAIEEKVYARVGVLGNPSDGYNGKTISCK